MVNYNEIDLNQLINVDKLTYEEIGRRYGVSGNAIKKAAKKMGIVLPQRRKINENETFNKGNKNVVVCLNCGKEYEKYPSSDGKFCSNKCCAEYRHKEKYKKIVDGDESIMRANYSPSKFRDFILKEQDYKCAICGCGCEHNNKPLVFIIDHINGDASNNKRDNLRAICPNCDSQLETFKSKNKNGSRHYYRYHT